MVRHCVVTGSASGIGAATAARLREAGDVVIGVDLRDAEVIADLSTAEGRAAAVAGVRARVDHLDVVVASAGTAAPIPKALQVNYFGAVALLDGLRPLLARGPAPRAVALTSLAVAYRPLRRVLEACVRGDEESALAEAQEAVTLGKAAGIYATSKIALALWIRQQAVSPEWAGQGITLNGVGPGIVVTPLIAEQLADPRLRAELESAVPMPLHGPVEAADIAIVLGWLVSTENSFVTGQNLFADGGADAVLRPQVV
jgi:NAD(P)-dependent dehydrogenase (short-subunit alcohol dehydrogenase family)